MKKIVFIFALILLSVGLFAQDRTTTVNMRASYTYLDFNPTAADTLGSVDQDTVDFIVYTNKEWPIQYYAWLNMDSTSGTPAVAVNISGRVFTDESWSSITTVNWAGTASDTTFTFSATSNQSYALAFSGSNTATYYNASTFTYDTTALWPGITNTSTIDSIFYTGSGTDTASIVTTVAQTATMTSTDIVKYYRYLRFRFICTSGTATIDELKLKLWERKL